MTRRHLLLGAGVLTVLGALLWLTAPPSGIGRLSCLRIRAGMSPEQVDAFESTTGWMGAGPSVSTHRTWSASSGWPRSSTARTCASIAEPSTSLLATIRSARWWLPAATASPKYDQSPTRVSVSTPEEIRAAAPGVRTLAMAAAAPTGDAPQAVRAGLLEVDAADLTGDLLEECFGPVTVLVRYGDTTDAEAVLSRLGGNLTATLHAEAGEPGAAAWLTRLSRFAGRVIFGGWPTGVAVAPAMTHGGPYPATTTPTTSVGGTAIDRWLRPVTYQTVPTDLLPPELSKEP